MIILPTTWLEINLFPRKKWVIYGEKKKPKRNEHTEISLTSDSGVAKAEVFPNLKTNAKSRNKTHTQPFLHANILSPFKSLQLWIRTEALVFNKLPCLSGLAPGVSGYLSSQVTNGQINPTDTHVGRHACSRCIERLFLCRKHICDLSTPRYRWSHSRQDFCNISFGKNENESQSWGV